MTDGFPVKHSNDKTRLAYLATGIDYAAVWHSPQIRHELGRICSAATRSTRNEPNPAPNDPYYFIATSDDPDARRIVEAYYSVPKTHRRFLPIEAICVKAGVPTTRALEIVQTQIMRLSRAASAAIVAATHPAVVEKTIDLALHAADERTQLSAQNTLHKAMGLTPQPKGAQTIVNVQANAQAIAESQSASVSAPIPEQTIRRLSERLTAIRELAPPEIRSLPDATGDDTTIPPRHSSSFDLVPASPSELYEEEEASDD